MGAREDGTRSIVVEEVLFSGSGGDDLVVCIEANAAEVVCKRFGGAKGSICICFFAFVD